MVQVGDSLPNVKVVEGAPDKQVDLAGELKNGYLIGVPGTQPQPTMSEGSGS